VTKLKDPPVPPDARTVLPGRAVTYHEAPTKAPHYEAPKKVVARRSGGTAASDMRALVLNVLVGARARWNQLSIVDKQKIVAHMRTIADTIESSIGRKAP